VNTAWLEREHVGAEGLDWAMTWAERLLVAGRAPWFYLGKLIWPQNLSFIYPRWVVDVADPVQHLVLFGTVAAGAALWLLGSRIGRGPFVAAAFFVGTLVPALGFFNVYPMRFSFVADHFQYLASLGPIALVAAGAARIGETDHRWARWLARGAAAVVVVVLGGLTFQRAGAYRNGEALWRDTLAHNPACWLCLNNLGAELTRDGRAEESLPLLAEAVRLRPDYAEARVNLGVSLMRTGRPQAALRLYDDLLKVHPDYIAALYNRGLALGQLGYLDEAIVSFGRIIQRAPGHALAQEGLGRALALEGRYDEAVEPLRLGLAAHPRDAESRRELAFVLNAAGRPAEAETVAREALVLDPNAVGARVELARALAGQGDREGARREAEEVLRRDPENAEAQRFLSPAGPPGS
jgi:tetratricopeptide (TPR) repeat protein